MGLCVGEILEVENWQVEAMCILVARCLFHCVREVGTGESSIVGAYVLLG